MEFNYQNNQLYSNKLPIIEITKSIETPFYCYSKLSIINNYKKFSDAFSDVNHKICYAVKANSNINILKILAENGSGADVVSMGEIFRCLKAGIDPKKMVFAGVGKTSEEIEYALKNGIEEFSVESEEELYKISKISLKIGKIAKISIRVNPNINAKTHKKISTGQKGDKFGIDIENAIEIYKIAQDLPNIKIFGISTHIGSQITNLEPFKLSFQMIKNLYLELKSQKIHIENLDFGGGIGILYENENILSISDYSNMIKDLISDIDVSITIAPGRSVVGNSGLLISKIIYIKKTDHKNFAIIDAAMNDLMRPGLYDSYHKILPLVEKSGNDEYFDIVGPVCETTDILAKNRKLTDAKSGDFIAIASVGAYGATMSNEYNSRPLIPEILIDENRFKIIRKRPSFDDMIRLEE